MQELKGGNLGRSQGLKHHTLPEAEKVSFSESANMKEVPLPPRPSWHLNPFHCNLFMVGLVLKDSSLDLQK